jgi:aspartate/methionine/tyrosine aminotransferase
MPAGQRREEAAHGGGAPLAAAAAAPLADAGAAPRPSRRVRDTDPPVIAKSKAIIAASGRTDVASLAQGVVHWPPPPAALATAAAATAAAAAAPTGPAAAALNAYGPTPGLPPLRAALRRALARAGLPGYEPVVTPGANAAFSITLLTIADASDGVILFPPTYFNHRMAVQMTGGAGTLVTAPLRADLRPDLDWLEAALGVGGGGGGGGGGEGGGGGGGSSGALVPRPRVVVLVNPANPTGVLLTRAELDRAADATAAAGAWLVVDNTYRDFVYDGREHYCPAGSHSEGARAARSLGH